MTPIRVRVNQSASTGRLRLPVLDPELEIDITGFAPGLSIDASDSTLRNVSVWGSDNVDVEIGNGAGGDVTGVMIENNILGTPPHRFDGSFAPSGNDHLWLRSEAKNGTVQNNLMGFGDGGGISVRPSATGWLVFQNELRNGGRAAGWGAQQDAVGDGASGLIVRGNLFVDLPGFGVDSYEGVGGSTIEQNTLRANGRLSPEQGGICLLETRMAKARSYLFAATEGSVAAPVDNDSDTGTYTDAGYGTDPSANRFSFTIATPAGLSVGDEMSPIAYLAADGTSEFGPNFTVDAAALFNLRHDFRRHHRRRAE